MDTNKYQTQQQEEPTATDKTVEGITLSTEYYTEKINNSSLANEINDGVATSDVSIRASKKETYMHKLEHGTWNLVLSKNKRIALEKAPNRNMVLSQEMQPSIIPNHVSLSSAFTVQDNSISSSARFRALHEDTIEDQQVPVATGPITKSQTTPTEVPKRIKTPASRVRDPKAGKNAQRGNANRDVRGQKNLTKATEKSKAQGNNTVHTSTITTSLQPLNQPVQSKMLGMDVQALVSNQFW